ncbi:hypothetical protein N9X06_02100 [Paracoccaceae bacterium]|nr:hypothetical protein [Paracoccaceae bacterium]
MKNVSKISLTKVLKLSSLIALLAGLCFIWLNIFSQVYERSVDLPTPLTYSELSTDQFNFSLILPSKLPTPSTTKNTDSQFVSERSVNKLHQPTEEISPAALANDYFIYPISDQVLDQLLSLSKFSETTISSFQKNYSSDQIGDTGDQLYSNYKMSLESKIPQFSLSSNYASFFSVTLMQDKLPPNIPSEISHFSAKRSVIASIRPKLRPENVNKGIKIAIGYFSQRENVIKAIKTVEMTGYPFQKTPMGTGDAHLLTLGPFTSKTNAKKALEIAKIIGFEDAYFLN